MLFRSRLNTGVELALADDTINQVMAGFWAAHALDKSIAKDLGLADAITLHAMLPPVVSTGADGAMHLTMGDLIATLSKAGVPVTTMAVNVEVALQASPSPIDPTVVKLSLGLPTIATDIIEDTSGLDQDSLARLLPAMIQMQLDGFAPILGSIPMPAVSGIRPVNVQVGGSAGYIKLAAGLGQ